MPASEETAGLPATAASGVLLGSMQQSKPGRLSPLKQLRACSGSSPADSPCCQAQASHSRQADVLHLGPLSNQQCPAAEWSSWLQVAHQLQAR